MKKSWVISLIFYPVLATGTFCLAFFLRGNYQLSGYIDPLFFSGIATLSIGLLTLLAHFGAFDFLAYGTRTIFKHMNPNYTNSQDKYPDYYAYVTGKKEKRDRNFPFIWPWLIISIGLFVASFIIRGIIFG